MRIERLHIENFGCLSDFSYAFSEGCNVICAENGWGKTTLSVFIRSMFYGFSAKGKRSGDRERYRPWNGGLYGGSLTFSADEGRYTVYRVFGKTKTGSQDSFQLVDEGSGLVSDRWTSEIGQELFGMNEDSFVNTAWISQGDMRVTATSDLTSGIGQESELLEDMKRYDELVQRLDRHLNHLTPDRKSGLLYKKRYEMQELESELRGGAALDEAIRRLRQRQGEEKELLQTMKLERELLEERQIQYGNWQDFLGKEEYYNSLQEEYLLRDREWDVYQERFPEGLPSDSSSRYAYSEKENRKRQLSVETASGAEEPAGSGRNRRRWFIAAGMVLLLMGIGILLAGMKAGLIPVIAGTGLVVAGVFTFENAADSKKDTYDHKAGQMQEEKKDQTIPAGEGWKEVRDAEAAWKELQRAERRLRSFLEKNPSFEELKERPVPEEIRGIGSVRELNEEMNRLNERIRELELSIRQSERLMEGRLNEQSLLTEKEEQLDYLKEEIRRLEKEYRTGKLTRKFLTEARDAFAVKYMDSVRDAFSKYYGMLDEKQKEKVSVDAEYNIRVLGGGILRSSDVLSRGYQDLTALCLRFALLDAIVSRERPFLILDDPFVNLDAEKSARTEAFLEACASGYQMICFTCR